LSGRHTVYARVRTPGEGVVLTVEPSRPRITGKDYSVYNPAKARLGMMLWVEAFIKAIPKHLKDEGEHGPETE
jgi:hypothetical protein